MSLDPRDPRVIGGGIAAAVMALAVPLYVTSEGWKNEPYRDPVGILTVCAGHTGPDVISGRHYSDAECRAIMARDFAEHNARMVACAPMLQQAPAEVYAAVLSFALNVGTGAFCRSTMAKRLQAGEWMAACAELSRWVMAGGKDCRQPSSNCTGIVARRARERAVCEGTLAPSLGVTG